MQVIGRLMQYAGLVALPAAIFLELSDNLGRSFGLSQMLIMLVFGFCAFQLGGFLEGFAMGDQA